MKRAAAAVACCLAALAGSPSAYATFPGTNGILSWSEGEKIYGLDPGSSTPRVLAFGS